MKKFELKPLEVNGITAVTIGTLIWLITFFAFIFSKRLLVNQGHEDWVQIAGLGFVLGLIGIRYTIRRHKKLLSEKPIE